MASTTESDKPRLLTVAAAQMGPVKSLSTPRPETLDRMLKLLEKASEKNVKLLVYPELAFTTFFASYMIKDPQELAEFFEQASPSDPYAFVDSPNIKPLIDRTNELGIDLYFGFGERWIDNAKTTDFNTAVYYSASQRKCLAKYRKVHLPGRQEPLTTPGFAQQLEKRYFTVGDLGFQAFRAPGLVEGVLTAKDVGAAAASKGNQGKGDTIIGMLLCNDRRWAEAWRCYGLQGVELLLVCIPPTLLLLLSFCRRQMLTTLFLTGRLQYNSIRPTIRRYSRMARTRSPPPPPALLPIRKLPKRLLQYPLCQSRCGRPRLANRRVEHRRPQRPYYC
jgi:predicted amidohydrolase